jgi:hypothetical protein
MGFEKQEANFTKVSNRLFRHFNRQRSAGKLAEAVIFVSSIRELIVSNYNRDAGYHL